MTPPLNLPHRLLVLGRSGLGKTNLLMWMLLNEKMYRYMFNKIYVFSPTVRDDPKWNALQIPNSRKFTQVTQEKIYELIDHQKKLIAMANEQNLPHPQVLVIFDDCGAEPEMRGHLYANPVDKLDMLARHWGFSLWKLFQNVISSSVPGRTNADAAICFEYTNVLQRREIWAEFGLGTFSFFERLYAYCTYHPREFLFINRQGPKARYFKNFGTEYSPKSQIPNIHLRHGKGKRKRDNSDENSDLREKLQKRVKIYKNVVQQPAPTET